MSDQNGLPTGKHTLVEEGTEFKGTMSSNCPIVVMGKVEGEVTGPVIHVTATGVVAGHVKVKELRSEGEMAGEVEAEVVRISGKVRDRTVIRARSLEVSLSTKSGMQVVFGECELAVGDEPNKEAAIAAATAQPAPEPTATAPEPAAPAPEPAATAPEPAATADAKDANAKDAKDGKKGGRGAAKTEPAAAGTDEEAGRRRSGTQPPPV
jgi:cytoskeletal protein CcmA (bactofilin family)